MNRARIAAASLVASLTWLAQPVVAQELNVLGAVESDARAISADGSTVVGTESGNAVRWTDAAGILSLALSGTARGVSADGSVIVGGTPGANGRFRAFRWTAGGNQILGVLNSDGTGFLDESIANDVSADGGVVVGSSFDADAFASRAFRWNATDGLTSLGTLPGGSDSYAYGVSADGATIVGSSNSTTSIGQEGFRWTSTGLTALGKLNGGNTSEAFAVSDDGSVVVGQASDGNANQSLRAFRWTQADGLMSLGLLNFGNSSQAHDISGDGKVIVGAANDGLDGNALKAFRWTAEAGMKSVEDWLRGAGATIAQDTTRIAYGTNTDGSIVVGQTADNRMFIARAGAGGGGDGGGGGDDKDDVGGDGGGDPPPGLITLDDLAMSIAGGGAANTAMVTSINTSLNGAGSRPLDRRTAPGRNVFWFTGDWGRSDHGALDGDMWLGEAGFGHNYGPFQLNGVIGGTASSQNTFLGGRTEIRGAYGKLEALVPLHGQADGGLWAVLTGVGMFGDATVRRNYDNGGLTDSSTGSPGVHAVGARARLEWDSALPYVSPYGEISWLRSCLAAYTETGGAFPASFGEQCETATEARLGLNATMPVHERLRLIAIAEGVHRFEATGSSVTGQVIGLGAFNVGGAANQRTWLRGGLGFEADIHRATFSFMANATTEGGGPSALLSSSVRMKF